MTCFGHAPQSEVANESILPRDFDTHEYARRNAAIRAVHHLLKCLLSSVVEHNTCNIGVVSPILTGGSKIGLMVSA